MDINKESVSVPELSSDAASNVLVNVFEACELEPSSLPIDTLSSYSEYRREKYTLQKYVLLFVFALFLILPLFFVAPRLELTLADPGGDYPTYTLNVISGLVPVSRVSAAVDGVPVSVYESGVRQFNIIPTLNGELSIRVTLANRQYNIATAEISGIDVDAPDFIRSSKDDENNLLSIYVSETGSGLNPEECYAYTVSGRRIDPVEIDTAAQCVVFAFPEESVTIFISDMKDNALQLVVTIPAV